jgi:hypothetical protein
VTKGRRKAAKLFESEAQLAGQGAMAMIDTDFASDVLSYASDGDLTGDTLRRRKDAGVGDDANMVQGFEWRSLDVSLDLNIYSNTHLSKVRRIFALAYTQKQEGP